MPVVIVVTIFGVVTVVSVVVFVSVVAVVSVVTDFPVFYHVFLDIFSTGFFVLHIKDGKTNICLRL